MRDPLAAFRAHQRFLQMKTFELSMAKARAQFKKVHAAIESRMQARISKWQAGLQIATASMAATASDGTPLTIDSATMSINRGRFLQQQIITKTYATNPADSTPDLVEEQGVLTRNFGPRVSFVAYRDRVNNSDGSFTITFSSTASVQPASGSVKNRTVNWTASGLADGSWTASGTLVQFNGRTVQLSMTGTASGSVATKAVDTSDDVEADLLQSDASTAATSQLGEPGNMHVKGAVAGSVPDTETPDLTDGQ